MRRRAPYTAILGLCVALLWSPAPLHGASAAGIQQEFGVGAVRSGAKPWSKQELATLDATLGALHRRELKAVANVDFVRGGAPRRPLGAGLFSWDRRGRRITIFNRAFHEGTPNWTVVHEIGHAISAWDLVTERRRSKTAIDAYNAAVDAYNDKVDAYNRSARRFNATQESSAKKQADRLRGQVERLAEAMDSKRSAALTSKRKVRHATRQFRSNNPRDGVLADYRVVLGRSRGPTRYGRTNLRESFAESFAMYRCDPARLKRALPAVHAWFARGGHIARIP